MFGEMGVAHEAVSERELREPKKRYMDAVEDMRALDVTEEDRKITIILNPGCQLIELITRLTEINDFLR